MNVKNKVRMFAIGLVAAVMLTMTAATASAATWHRHYYDNYFKSFPKCIARGEQVIGHRDASQAIYGAISYVCYKAPGKPKYSMDILFEDYSGGGGGGGGGSWVTTPMQGEN